jgi:divalent metal cation (Fe/Co/Zn/Cd) transporter
LISTQVVERLRARKAGPGIVADLVLSVPAGLSASAAHQVGEHGAVALRRAASEAGVAVADVQVHLDPSDRQERDTRLAALPSTLEKRVTVRALRHPRVRGVAHCVVRYDNTKVLAKVDVILPDAMTLRAAHGVAGALRRSILRGVPELHEVDVDCELDERRARTSRRGVGRGRHTSCM